MHDSPETVAAKLRITYNGLQRRVKGPPLYLFNDPQTGSSFAVFDLKETAHRLKLKRSQFGQTVNKGVKQ